MECTVGSLAHETSPASHGVPRRAFHFFALARTNELHLLAECTAAPIVRTPHASPLAWLRHLLHLA